MRTNEYTPFQDIQESSVRIINLPPKNQYLGSISATRLWLTNCLYLDDDALSELCLELRERVRKGVHRKLTTFEDKNTQTDLHVQPHVLENEEELMDKSVVNNKSGQIPEESLQESILRKFNFLRSFKNYVFSKFRSGKYELSDNCSREISIVSYEQRTFADVEREFDLPPSSSVKVNQKVIEALKKVLKQIPNDQSQQNRKTRTELLEIVEKTFNRQLDIFEELLQLINADNNVTGKMDPRRKQIKANTISEDSVDGYVNGIMRNLLTELTNATEATQQTALHNAEAAEPTVSNIERHLGDNHRVKKPNIT
ncbi:uncharacterized protein BDFB_002908, partial [Asbolus verrucosus]